MKSPMLSNNDLAPEGLTHPRAVSGGYTDMQTMRSAAGWYIGTAYEERDAKGEIVWQEPGGRDSGYYPTQEAAASALCVMKALGDETAAMVLRAHP